MQEYSGEAVKLRNTLACRVLGGRFKKRLGIVKRTLEGGVCEVEAYSCMYGFGGGGLENDLESNKKSWRGEAVKLRNTLACRVLGGRFKK